jgi:hypothetical protein
MRDAIVNKQSQTWAPWGVRGTGRGAQGKCAKQTQFRRGLKFEV